LGYWSKKIDGRILHFGRWARVKNGKLEPLPYEENWNQALRTYRARLGDVHEGRVVKPVVSEIPPEPIERPTVKSICDRFLTAKARKVAAGEITQRTLTEYTEFCQRMADSFGKSRLVATLETKDFEKLRAEAAEIWGPHRLGKFIQYIRTAFKYAYDSELIDKPVKFGPEFKRPSKKVMRKHKNEQGERYFTADEIRHLLNGKTIKVKGEKTKRVKGAGPQLRAMILLGINCGFGNSDVADLQRAKVDLVNGWIDFPRPKTGIDRRCPLWPETIKAIKAALAVRLEPKNAADSDCVFVTVRRNRWVQGKTNSVGLEFGKLRRSLHINGRTFYGLRHTFRTIADAAKDQPAANLIMGHADETMAGIYRQHIDDERLLAVTNHVRGWLFGTKGGAK
jgi:integrase